MNTQTIRITIPSEAGRLHGHFGGAKEFTLVDADRKLGVVTQKQVVAAPPHEPGLFPRWLREQGVRVVLAGNDIGSRHRRLPDRGAHPDPRRVRP